MKIQQTEPLHITVKKIMIEKGINQKFLAQEFHLHKSSISIALSGKRKRLLNEIYQFVLSYKLKKVA
jgi:hypothetical protein